MNDQNATIKSHHEVRVTMRGVRLTLDGDNVQVSTRSDFVAPDMAPVPQTDIEQAKSLKGWTDITVKVAAIAVTDHKPKGLNDRVISEYKLGPTIKRPRPVYGSKNRTRV